MSRIFTEKNLLNNLILNIFASSLFSIFFIVQCRAGHSRQLSRQRDTVLRTKTPFWTRKANIFHTLRVAFIRCCNVKKLWRAQLWNSSKCTVSNLRNIQVLFSDGSQQECSEGPTKVINNQEVELLCKS